MSTRVVRTLRDFIRHRMGVEVICECGNRAVLDARQVYAKFSAKGWPISLDGAAWLPSAHAYFRCSKCGSRPRGVGPIER